MKKYKFILVTILLFLLSAAAAVFSACLNIEREFTINYCTDGNGTIRGEAVQTVLKGENGSFVTAVAGEGYFFASWSDGITAPERREENVVKNLTVTAVFKKIEYTLNYETDGNGTIQGKAVQSVKYGEAGESVVAVAKRGYEFVDWSDGVESAERCDENITAHKSVTARFKRMQFDVFYTTDGNGSIKGKQLQTVLGGDSTQSVTAIPDGRFVFLKWSDGVTSPTRYDVDVFENLTIVAYFGYQIEFKVNNNVGGKLIGDTLQTVLPQQDCTPVKAVADKGYVFSGWCDLNTDAERKVVNAYISYEYMAYFEPVEKTFKYDYGKEYKTPAEPEITLNRYNLQNVKFAMPQLAGYKFCGWYADKNYKVKVVNENGIYMLGYSGFILETDTLYARWETDEESEIPVYKLLIVYTDEVNALLFSSVTNGNVDVNYKMSGFDRVLCLAVTDKMHYCLNDWFGGTVKFEVDSYFTLIPVGSESFDRGMTTSGKLDYTVDSNDLPELFKLNGLYHSTLTAFGLGEAEEFLSFVGGSASNKYGSVVLDDTILGANYNPPHITLQQEIDCDIITDKNVSIIRAFMHEFTHTCEMTFGHDSSGNSPILVKGFHEIKDYYIINLKLDHYTAIKAYLLGEAKFENLTCGIPYYYWQHKIDISVNYVGRPIDMLRAGKIVEIVNGEELSNTVSYISKDIAYSSTITVKAVPNEGYSFLQWSDGVTTAVRRDENVISYINVEAIFIKIDK